MWLIKIYAFCVYDSRTVAQFAFGAVHNTFPVLFGEYTVSEKDCTLFFIFFLGAQCVESGVSCTDCY